MHAITSFTAAGPLRPRTMSNVLLGTCVSCLFAVLGCGADERFESSAMKSTAMVIPASAAVSDRASGGLDQSKSMGTTPADMSRKIIYNAQVTLVVESLSTASAELLRLVKAHGGYVAETDVTSYSHMRRNGSWKVRVPVESFNAFLAAVSALGELQQSHIDSQDVTQEYHDLEAQIANKQVEEKRLVKHLTESTGKLEDILAVERELSRVRGEIERMQGRIRYLANQTALSTVTISASELKDYTPPVSPTFNTKIGRTFRDSVTALVNFGKGVILFVVAAAPWVPIVALFILPIWAIMRRRRAARRARTV